MTTETSPAASAMREIDAPALKLMMDNHEAFVIDVREADEYAHEHIAGTKLMPLSTFNPADAPHAAGMTIVMQCRSGRRSADAAARLIAVGRTGIVNLKGGIEAWKAAGLPVQTGANKNPLSIMRQVQITAGGTVFVSSVLAWLVSPWFLALSGFFGAGLLVAGLTGTCGMATVLSHMPWNKH
ncbi:MAG TPA: rhodanese-like domain-containing protein [Phycisphaerales bacterium]|nr:rhodanese-like domain-containing protein [Phycisphaerales bacterium]